MSNVYIYSEATVFSCSLQGHYMHGAIVQRNGVLFKCWEHTLHNAREPRSPGGLLQRWEARRADTTMAADPGAAFPGGGRISISNDKLC